MDVSPDQLKQRYVVLDSYRFLAAFGIVVYHFNAHFSAFRPPQPDALDRFQTLVDFFFVLSGFVMMHTYGAELHDIRTYGDFLRKRLARIFPLHLATVLLCIAIYATTRLGLVKMQDISLVDMGLVPANLLLVHAWGFTNRMGLNSPSWSISAEAFVYILYPGLVMIVVRLRPFASLVIAVLIGMTIEWARGALDMRSGSVATFDFGMMRAVPMFLAGICVHEIVSRAKSRSIPWSVPYALSGTVVGLMFLRAPLFLIDMVYPVLVAAIAFAERGRRPTFLNNAVFAELGNASFAIYMLHTFVAVGCVRLVHITGWSSTPALIGLAAVGTAVVVLVGVASFHYFETPSRRWLGGPKLSGGSISSRQISHPQTRPAA